jgi:hypothetical protein
VTIVSEPSLSSSMECKLSTFGLVDAPSYIALSYVWGDIRKTTPITLNDAEIHVTTNLLAALRRMSAWDPGTYFWIDALCINQSNTEEKGHQVSMMRNIYQQAMFVTMWLGVEQDDSNLAMSMIEAWGRAYNNTDNDLDSKSRVAAALAMLNDAFDEAAWKAIELFLQRPYWKRIWIVQEVALSQRALIVCGDADFESVYFWFAITLWESVIQPEVTNLVTADQQMSIINSGHRSSLNLMAFHSHQAFGPESDTPFVIKLQQHILGTRRHLASDPRDKVYGLFGLVDENGEECIPDYEKNVIQVYTDVVVSYIHATNKFASIYFEGIGILHENRIPGLPSWVPDFSNITDRSYRIHTLVEPGMPGFSSAEDTTAKVTFSQDFKLLAAVGTIVDEISDIEPIGYDSISEEHLVRWLHFSAALCPPFHPTGMPWRQVFFRTLVGDKSGHGYGKSDFKNDKLRDAFYEQAVGFLWFFGLEPGRNGVKLVEAIRGCTSAKGCLQRIDELYPDEDIAYFVKLFLFCDEQLLGPFLDEGHTEIARQTLLNEFCGQPGMKWHLDSFVSKFREISKRQLKDVTFLHVHVLSAQRRLFVTKDGYMGTAPMGAQKGDRICVLLGCNVPLIIRPEGDGFLIIGDTYIYGMMNGEVMQDIRNGKHRCEDLRFM